VFQINLNPLKQIVSSKMPSVLLKNTMSQRQAKLFPILLISAMIVMLFITIDRQMMLDSYDSIKQNPLVVKSVVTAVKPQAQTELLEQQYQKWLASYKPTDPHYTELCLRVIRDGQGGGSQFEQDAFLFHNIFRYWPMQGRVGFYVDSGANDAVSLSNTLFFDKCLGWPGLCVEPNPQYHEGLRTKRSCALVPECISDKSQQVPFQMNGETGAVASGGQLIQCSPLSEMIKLAGKSKIDLWSLDVEGYEITVLQSVNFTQVPVEVLLIEDFWLQSRELDLLMDRSGFQKYHQLAIDSLYTRRGMEAVSNKVWYPPQFENGWKSNQEFRQSVKGQLKC
jgi:hypothetical protein